MSDYRANEHPDVAALANRIAYERDNAAEVAKRRNAPGHIAYSIVLNIELAERLLTLLRAVDAPSALPRENAP